MRRISLLGLPISLALLLVAACTGMGSKAKESDELTSLLEFHIKSGNSSSDESGDNGFEEYSLVVFDEAGRFSIDYRKWTSDEKVEAREEANGRLSGAGQDEIEALMTPELLRIYESDDGGEKCYDAPSNYVYRWLQGSESSSACLVRSDSLAPETVHMVTTIEELVLAELAGGLGAGGAGKD